MPPVSLCRNFTKAVLYCLFWARHDPGGGHEFLKRSNVEGDSAADLTAQQNQSIGCDATQLLFHHSDTVLTVTLRAQLLVYKCLEFAVIQIGIRRAGGFSSDVKQKSRIVVNLINLA